MVTIQKLKTILSALIKYKIDVKADKSQVLFYEIEDTLELSSVELEVSDDGNGNVTVKTTGMNITDDGNGNVTITSEHMTVTDDGNGNVTITV